MSEENAEEVLSLSGHSEACWTSTLQWFASIGCPNQRSSGMKQPAVSPGLISLGRAMLPSMARVPYCEPTDLPEEYRDLIVSTLQPGKTVNVYAAVGNNPHVLHGLRSFLGELWSDTGLNGYERELVILTVAREIDSAYEWHQHVGIARGEGVSDDEITAIGNSAYNTFDAETRPLLEYARAVVHGEVTDDEHDALASLHNDESIVGVAGLAAGYAMLGRLIDTLGVEIETGDEFVGWTLEAD